MKELLHFFGLFMIQADENDIDSVQKFCSVHAVYEVGCLVI